MNEPTKLVEKYVASHAGLFIRASDFNGVRPESVSKVLSRLAGAGKLERVAKGVYYVPKVTLLGRSHPSASLVAEETLKGRVRPRGLTASQMLGISTQLAVRKELVVYGQVHVGEGGLKVRRRKGDPGNGYALLPQEAALFEVLRDRGRFSELGPHETVARILRLLVGSGSAGENLGADVIGVNSMVQRGVQGVNAVFRLGEVPEAYEAQQMATLPKDHSAVPSVLVPELEDGATPRGRVQENSDGGVRDDTFDVSETTLAAALGEVDENSTVDDENDAMAREAGGLSGSAGGRTVVAAVNEQGGRMASVGGAVYGEVEGSSAVYEAGGGALNLDGVVMGEVEVNAEATREEGKKVYLGAAGLGGAEEALGSKAHHAVSEAPNLHRLKVLAAAALLEPPRVRAILGALFEAAGVPPRYWQPIRTSLNPLSRFEFGAFRVLPNAKAWQAK